MITVILLLLLLLLLMIIIMGFPRPERRAEASSYDVIKMLFVVKLSLLVFAQSTES